MLLCGVAVEIRSAGSDARAAIDSRGDQLFLSNSTPGKAFFSLISSFSIIISLIFNY